MLRADIWIWSKSRTLKLEDLQDLVLLSTYSPCVCKCALRVLKVIFSQERMTPKAEQIHFFFFFLSPGMENKTKHRKMHERQRDITSLFRMKMRKMNVILPDSITVLPCCAAREGSSRGSSERAARQGGDELHLQQRKDSSHHFFQQLPSKACWMSESEEVMESSKNWTCAHRNWASCLYTATTVWILLEARAWEFVETLCGSALLLRLKKLYFLFGTLKYYVFSVGTLQCKCLNLNFKTLWP